MHLLGQGGNDARAITFALERIASTINQEHKNVFILSFL